MSRKLSPLARLCPLVLLAATGCALEEGEVDDLDTIAGETEFKFMVSARHNGGTGANDKVGDFPYLRTLSKYDSDAHWLDGDRLGYRCVWTFLEYEGKLVGRVFFNRIGGPDGAYSAINDSGMKEGVRNFDGSIARPTPSPGGGFQTEHVNACDEKFPATPYEMLPANFTGPRPIIKFLDADDGHPLEIRDYNNVQAGRGVAFRIVETSPTLTKVVMYQDRFPVLAGYYESLSSSIRKTTN